MKLEEIIDLEDEIVAKGCECPFAPYEPMSEEDEKWMDEYGVFVEARRAMLSVSDWIDVFREPGFEMLKDGAEVALERRGDVEFALLCGTDICTLLNEFPVFEDRCDLSKLDVADWVDLCANSEHFCDEKYSVFPNWKKAQLI